MDVAEKIYPLLIKLVEPEELIYFDENAPRPALPYWCMRVQSTVGIGRDEHDDKVDVNGTMSTFGNRECTLSIERIGRGSDSKLLDLMNSLKSINTIDSWHAYNIEIYDMSGIMRVPYEMDNDHLEHRATIDVFLRFGSELCENVGIIETIESTGDVGGVTQVITVSVNDI